MVPKGFVPVNRDPISAESGGYVPELTRYRMMFLFHNIKDVPSNLDITKNYYIEYQMFD